MDNGDVEDIGNWLMFFVTVFAILGCLLGLVMTYFSLIKPLRKQATSYKDKSRCAI
jgi:preprotein translocase subunit YajC